MSEQKYTRLGHELKTIRQGLGLSLRQLADQFGVNHQRIILWEKGANKPSKRYRDMWERQYPWIVFDWAADVEVMTDEQAGADMRSERRLDERTAA